MNIRTRLTVLLAGGLLLAGCSSAEQSKKAQRDADAVCINRHDLKLVIAASLGDTPTMQSSLKAGADINISIEGLSTPIVAAGSSQNPGAVQFLLDNGANINATDADGYRAIINAVIANDENTVQLLISRGADVKSPARLNINTKEPAVFTPLSIAKEKRYEKIVKLLTDAGAE